MIGFVWIRGQRSRLFHWLFYMAIFAFLAWVALDEPD